MLTVFLCLPHDLLGPLPDGHDTRLEGKETSMSRYYGFGYDYGFGYGYGADEAR